MARRRGPRWLGPMTIDKLFDHLSGSGGSNEPKCFEENLGVLRGFMRIQSADCSGTGAARSL
jgi:hypothetical protein